MSLNASKTVFMLVNKKINKLLAPQLDNQWVVYMPFH